MSRLTDEQLNELARIDNLNQHQYFQDCREVAIYRLNKLSIKDLRLLAKFYWKDPATYMNKSQLVEELSYDYAETLLDY